MKREFPVLYAKASTVIATPILAITRISYIQRAITQPASEIYSLTMAAFGVTAALSAVCFTMAPSSVEDPTVRYAAEKFLHSSLLIIQSLIVIYAKDAIISTEWVRAHTIIKMITSAVAVGIVSLVAAAAAWTWYWGFSELNSQLWRNWKRRIKNINKAPSLSQQEKTEKTNDKGAP